MSDKKQLELFLGPLASEIKEFIDFKRRSGFVYKTPEYTLKAFDRFCTAEENQGMAPQELADSWVKASEGRPKYDDGCCFRQLGQYLIETGNPKAFKVLSAEGNTPRQIGIKPGPFAGEIKEFVKYKQLSGRKYIAEEYCLKAFDTFCAIKEDGVLTPQQLADAWRWKAKQKNNTFNIGIARELGVYLAIQGSKKSFMIPYANGDMPKPAFAGYTSLFAEDIESFLEAKRSAGLKYRHEEFSLKDFDRFCNEHPALSPQQMADAFLHSQKGLSYSKGRRSNSVIKAFGNYLTDCGCQNAFTIINKYLVAGPYAEAVSDFIAFKKSCGFKYVGSGNYLKRFDVFCASKENESLNPQQLADKWCLKIEDEHPNPDKPEKLIQTE